MLNDKNELFVLDRVKVGQRVRTLSSGDSIITLVSLGNSEGPGVPSCPCRTGRTSATASRYC
jgi:hypothetical protein